MTTYKASSLYPTFIPSGIVYIESMADTAKRVLIIEDNSDVLTALTEQFQQEGCEVLGFTEGVSGLEGILSERPDVVLMDLWIPGIRGIELLKHLRQQPAGKKIPVVVLTNVDEPAFVSEAAALGVSDYLVKLDHSVEDIVKRVKNILASQPLSQT